MSDALTVLKQVWEDNDAPYVGLARKTVETDRFHRDLFRRGDWNAIEEYLDKHRDSNVYANVLGFKQPRAINKNAVWNNWLFADLDERDPRKIKLRPTIAIESSPGRHVGLWYMEDSVNDEELNKKLSWLLCKDKSGWEGAKVLRLFPGVRNYKYGDEPRVSILWDDGPTYKRKDIEDFVSPIDFAKHHDETLQPPKSMSYYRARLGARASRMIRDGAETTLDGENDRSRVAHYLIGLMAEKGVPQEEAFTLMSSWNDKTEKYKDDDRLEADIERVYDKVSVVDNKIKKSVAKRKEIEGDLLKIIDLDPSMRKNTNWWWSPYLAEGQFHVFAGDPGVGKSYILLNIARAFADKGNLPSVEGGNVRMPQGVSLLFMREDDVEESIVPRLDDMNPPLKNWHNIKIINTPFFIMDDDYFKAVDEAMTKYKPKFVAFDTLTKFFGDGDMFRANEVAQVMERFTMLAKRHNTIVATIVHLNKSGKDKAMYRVADSREIVASARVVLMVNKIPDDGDFRRAITVAKANNAPDNLPAMTFKLHRLKDITRGGQTFSNRSQLEWTGPDEEVNSETLNKKTTGERGEKKERKEDVAKRFLERMLDQGPVESELLRAMAKDEGVNKETLRRVYNELNGVTPYRNVDHKYVWRLPNVGQKN